MYFFVLRIVVLVSFIVPASHAQSPRDEFVSRRVIQPGIATESHVGDGESVSSSSVSDFDFSKRAAHWCFQPIHVHELPNVNDRKWARRQIDRFVLAKLEQVGLHPAAVADRFTLIRRVYFDLLGLPPVPAEIDSFVSDPAPLDEAFAVVVDRLLASPHFGERWARHWLDVVRYSETTGHVTDVEREHAWRYRDYVIAALNEDLPYDQFVREHLAGDLLATPRASHQEVNNIASIATGFLWFHEMHFKPIDPNAQRADQIDAQIDVVSKAFLGLTVACARCHDHKFDAISQEDYYALAGIFHSTVESQINWEPSVTLNAAAELRQKQQRLQELIDQGTSEAIADRSKKTENLPPVSETVFSKGIKEKIMNVRADMRQLDLRTAWWAPAAAEGVATDVHLHVRGSHKSLGEKVSRRFISAINGVPINAVEGSGRLFLARELTSPANPLTARVQVNRIWQHLFGQGIVRSPNNFGKQGAPPTHPKLLDYLAARYMQQGWSTKRLLREILLSNAYQMSSLPSDRAVLLDPENKKFQHQSVDRLEAETIRDSLLFICGYFDKALLGPSIAPFISPNVTSNKPIHIPKSGPLDGYGRRSIYLKVRRNFGNPLLATFDFPDPSASVGKRRHTYTSSQALALMNSPFVHQQANRWAKGIMASGGNDDSTRLRRIFLRVLGRPISYQQKQFMEQFVASCRQESSSEHEVWAEVAHVLFNLNEFLFVR